MCIDRSSGLSFSTRMLGGASISQAIIWEFSDSYKAMTDVVRCYGCVVI
jgi:hypothetical protein